MARLPTRDDLGALPSVRPSGPVSSPNLTQQFTAQGDIGRAIAGIGQAVTAFADQDQAQKDYESERQFQEFYWNQKLGLDEAKRTAEPGSIAGFASGVEDSYTAAAKQFLAGVPEPLKAKYDEKLVRGLQTLQGDALTFQQGELKRESETSLTDFKNKRLPDVQEKDFPAFRQDFVNRINMSPYLTPIEKDKLRREKLDDLEATYVQQRIARLKADVEAGKPVDPKELSRLSEGVSGRAALPGKPAGQQAASAARDPRESMAAISGRLETGKKDWREGLGSVRADAKGSRSYGNFGLNTTGGETSSAARFARDYGEELGLKGTPGTAEFDRSWKQVARDNPDELRLAEMQWHQRTIQPRVTVDLVHAGVSDAVAQDPRVQAYFADRLVQYGPASIGDHEKRVAAAFAASGGDAGKFLEAMSDADVKALPQNFRSALADRTASMEGLRNRVYGRFSLAMAEGGDTAAAPANTGPYPNLSPEKRIQLQTQIDTARTEIDKQMKWITRRDAILNGREPADPGNKTDRDILDKAFSDVPARLDNEDPKAAGLLAIAAKGYGYVPEPAISKLRAMATNGTPEQRIYALETTANIAREKPGALDASDTAKSLREDAQLYEIMTASNGLGATEALQRIAEIRSPAYQARKDAMKQQIAETGQLSALKDLTYGDITARYDGWFSSAPALGGSERERDVIFNGYRDLVQYHYIQNGGNIDWAKAAASDDLLRTYNVSEVTGNKRLMRDPPERWYPKVAPAPGEEPDYSYIGEELQRVVNDYVRGSISQENPETRAQAMSARQQMAAPGASVPSPRDVPEIPLSDIFLEALPVTRGDAGKRAPRYGVAWIEYRDGQPRIQSAPMLFSADVKAAQARLGASEAANLAKDEQERARVLERQATRKEGERAARTYRGGIPGAQEALQREAEEDAIREQEQQRLLLEPDPAAERLRGGNREFFDQQQRIQGGNGASRASLPRATGGG